MLQEAASKSDQAMPLLRRCISKLMQDEIQGRATLSGCTAKETYVRTLPGRQTLEEGTHKLKQCAICQQDLFISFITCCNKSCKDRAVCALHTMELCSCDLTCRRVSYRYSIDSLDQMCKEPKEGDLALVSKGKNLALWSDRASDSDSDSESQLEPILQDAAHSLCGMPFDDTTFGGDYSGSKVASITPLDVSCKQDVNTVRVKELGSLPKLAPPICAFEQEHNRPVSFNKQTKRKASDEPAEHSAPPECKTASAHTTTAKPEVDKSAPAAHSLPYTCDHCGRGLRNAGAKVTHERACSNNSSKYVVRESNSAPTQSKKKPKVKRIKSVSDQPSPIGERAWSCRKSKLLSYTYTAEYVDSLKFTKQPPRPKKSTTNKKTTAAKPTAAKPKQRQSDWASERAVDLLCIGGCGFYGSIEQDDYCSRCYQSKLNGNDPAAHSLPYTCDYCGRGLKNAGAKVNHEKACSNSSINGARESSLASEGAADELTQGHTQVNRQGSPLHTMVVPQGGGVMPQMTAVVPQGKTSSTHGLMEF